MKRISIIGPAGSGKSTLAVKLGKILNLPVYHIDAVKEQIDKIADGEEWIIDGNKIATLEKRVRCSDSVIFLNFPVEFCISSVNQRDNSTRLGSPKVVGLSDDEFRSYCLNVLANWHSEKGEAIKALAEKYKHKFTELKTREEVNEYVNKLKARLLKSQRQNLVHCQDDIIDFP